MCFLLYVVFSSRWFLHQFDVDNTFFHGDLTKQVYMQLPHGFLHYTSKMVYKLQRSLHGLRLASKQWNAKLTSALLTFCFIQSFVDRSLFIQHNVSSIKTFLVYLNDILLNDNNISFITKIKLYLHAQFHIKDLGQLKFFLDFEVVLSTHGLVLNLRKYCLDILSEFSLIGCKPTNTPSIPFMKLNVEDGVILYDITIFRRLIGKLIYLTKTYSIIYFVV